MTAKEKFEARAKELGVSFEELTLSGYAGLETKDGIIILVHYDHEDGYFTEYHYPRFDSMSRDQMDTLTAHFASEYCNPDHKAESEFFSKLANWCAGYGSTPLFACDCYLNIDPTEEINFEDDPEEETAYLEEIARNAREIEHIQQNLQFYKQRLTDMIRAEFHRGHNLQNDFDPYPGWETYHLCGYDTEGKTMVIEETQRGSVILALYDGERDYIKFSIDTPDFPIEVLLNIYASMK